MKEMSLNQLEKINGGGFNWAVALSIAAGVVFVIGVLDGFIRPLRCN